MHIWMNLLLVVQLLSALAMIGLVLVQHGKGADMGASFGSGASGSLFGATGSANFLSRSTAACATVFFLTTLALAFASSGAARRADAAAGSSVLDKPAITAPAATAASQPAQAVIPVAPQAQPSALPVAPAATPSASAVAASATR